MKIPCPTKTKQAGAELLKARRLASDLVEQLFVTRAAVKDAARDLKQHGMKEMELGEGLEILMSLMDADARIMRAHNSFRPLLGRCNVEEPTDDDLIVILGGGGGGR